MKRNKKKETQHLDHVMQVMADCRESVEPSPLLVHHLKFNPVIVVRIGTRTISVFIEIVEHSHTFKFGSSGWYKSPISESSDESTTGVGQVDAPIYHAFRRDGFHLFCPEP
jgi:hypothetical protein